MQAMEHFLILPTVVFLAGLVLVLLFYDFKLISSFRTYVYQVTRLIMRINHPEPGGNLTNLSHIRYGNDMASQNNQNVFVLYADDDRTFVINELIPIV